MLTMRTLRPAKRNAAGFNNSALIGPQARPQRATFTTWSGYASCATWYATGLSTMLVLPHWLDSHHDDVFDAGLAEGVEDSALKWRVSETVRWRGSSSARAQRSR